MLRPDLAPLDMYLADAMLLDPESFVLRHPWPMLVIAEPDWSKIAQLSRPDTVRPGQPLPALLELIDPANTGASLDALCLAARPLDGGSADRITLGRSPDADVVVLDETVSKLHAELAWDPEAERMVLTDQGARNGTTVEGTRLPSRGAVELGSGALLTLGSVVVRAYTPQGFLAWLVAGATRAGAIRMR